MRENGAVPLIVQQCTAIVEEKGSHHGGVPCGIVVDTRFHVGYDLVGVYRLSGNVSEIQKLRLQFNSGMSELFPHIIVCISKTRHALTHSHSHTRLPKSTNRPLHGRYQCHHGHAQALFSRAGIPITHL